MPQVGEHNGVEAHRRDHLIVDHRRGAARLGMVLLVATGCGMVHQPKVGSEATSPATGAETEAFRAPTAPAASPNFDSPAGNPSTSSSSTPLSSTGAGSPHVEAPLPENEATLPQRTSPQRGGPMVAVAAGPYWTGCARGQDPHCRVQDGSYQRVHLEAYRIDVYEVTVADYAACVEAGGCCDRGLRGYDDGTRSVEWQHCNWGRADRADHPLNCVDWVKADTYCRWAGKRLPTEAEWEKAARGDDKRRYPWGDAPITCEYAVTNETANEDDKGCGLNRTMPVGSKPKGVSPYGVHDIVGNVWEWTADAYVPPSGAASLDPREGVHRVGKGGCWGSGNPWNSRISWSHHYPAIYGSNVRLGFRCAADAGPTP
ncbi:MAG: SUMF1/EgtB/PvdO family nonheme iron enzyme [Myxococcota bacterium]